MPHPANDAAHSSTASAPSQTSVPAGTTEMKTALESGYATEHQFASVKYTEKVDYESARIGEQCRRLVSSGHWVPRPFPKSPLWTRMFEDFDIEHYLYPAPPLDLGCHDIPAAALEETRGLRVLRCPMKRPGDAALLLPSELLALQDIVGFILDLEASINPNWANWHAHLTFEHTWVEAGRHQRVPGWHVDGFQGVRAPRHCIEHSYLWANACPTQYALQPFALSHLDPARHNIFFELERQAQAAFETFAHHLYLIDPYVVHRTSTQGESGWRAFMRLTFTPTELEDPSNTVNLSLACGCDYAPRLEVRNRLTAHKGAPPWEVMGFKPL